MNPTTSGAGAGGTITPMLDMSPRGMRVAPMSYADSVIAGRFVTVLMGVVVGLTFVFGFGNITALGIRLGVPVYVAPLVAPAVDLSVIALLVGTRQLAVLGAPAEQLRPAHRLLVFVSLVTLALNVTEPVVTGHYGRAAFDAVGYLRLVAV